MHLAVLSKADGCSQCRYVISSTLEAEPNDSWCRAAPVDQHIYYLHSRHCADSAPVQQSSLTALFHRDCHTERALVRTSPTNHPALQPIYWRYLLRRTHFASTPIVASCCNDCGTLGIVLFKLRWNGRYRTVLTVKCSRQKRIP